MAAWSLPRFAHVRAHPIGRRSPTVPDRAWSIDLSGPQSLESMSSALVMVSCLSENQAVGCQLTNAMIGCMTKATATRALASSIT